EEEVDGAFAIVAGEGDLEVVFIGRGGGELDGGVFSAVDDEGAVVDGPFSFGGVFGGVDEGEEVDGGGVRGGLGVGFCDIGSGGGDRGWGSFFQAFLDAGEGDAGEGFFGAFVPHEGVLFGLGPGEAGGFFGEV